MNTTPTPATWRKSSHSNTERECVELAALGGAVGIRDSKAPDAGTLLLSRRALARLLTTV
ncbi:DUF397 domain-containing protein [Actinomadura parmotrematis]|uniref:DUF397 domain-containing protein n=1 Tax=Actinomadura parmotrematis TaxID=2864039 RepID=A0ABS7G258_9ACTN|nr:DUF397 domain-containing protein [Actinomadura parmotrematis]MBW8485964.1 DUF397 domain-containing protein [Actinomadura parmotrematis]